MFYTILGFIGSAIIITQYCLNMAGKIRSDSLQYPLTNMIASILILFSLWNHFNAPSFIIEIFWFCASLFGIIRALLKRKNALD